MIELKLLELVEEYAKLSIVINGCNLAIKLLELDESIDDSVMMENKKIFERDRSYAILKKELVENYNFETILKENTIEFMKLYYFNKKKPQELSEIFNITHESTKCKIKRLRYRLENITLKVFI